MHLGENVKIEPKGSCPDGWAKFDVNCYIMPNIYLSFDDARGYCENVTTGELVTIYTENEYNTILNFTNTHSSGGLYPFWVNLVPDFWYPYWIWGDGLDMKYKKWYNGKTPASNSGVNCVAWRTVSGDDGWYAVPCKYAQPFICKQPQRTCDTVTVNATEGNATSPGYPGPYPLDVTCNYILTVPEGNVVQMHFDDFDIDQGDYITLYDGADIGGTADRMALLDYTFGYIYYIYYFESIRNSIGLQFTTGDWSYYGPGEGFVVHFYAVEAPTPTVLNPVEGNLTSPNYPNNYNDSLELHYVINSAPGTKINIDILDFVTEESYDWLLIIDGPNVNGATLLDWNGDHTADCPHPIQTTSNGAYLIFYADSMFSEKGFSLTYRAVSN